MLLMSIMPLLGSREARLFSLPFYVFGHAFAYAFAECHYLNKFLASSALLATAPNLIHRQSPVAYLRASSSTSGNTLARFLSFGNPRFVPSKPAVLQEPMSDPMCAREDVDGLLVTI
jgi:hypothetical protein